MHKNENSIRARIIPKKHIYIQCLPPPNNKKIANIDKKVMKTLLQVPLKSRERVKTATVLKKLVAIFHITPLHWKILRDARNFLEKLIANSTKRSGED